MTLFLQHMATNYNLAHTINHFLSTLSCIDKMDTCVLFYFKCCKFSVIIIIIIIIIFRPGAHTNKYNYRQPTNRHLQTVHAWPAQGG